MPTILAETEMVGTLRFAHPTDASSRHCEERSDEAIHSAYPRGDMDCFAEPVIGRAFARPVGSQ